MPARQLGIIASLQSICTIIKESGAIDNIPVESFLIQRPYSFLFGLALHHE